MAAMFDWFVWNEVTGWMVAKGAVLLVIAAVAGYLGIDLFQENTNRPDDPDKR